MLILRILKWSEFMENKQSSKENPDNVRKNDFNKKNWALFQFWREITLIKLLHCRRNKAHCMHCTKSIFNLKSINKQTLMSKTNDIPPKNSNLYLTNELFCWMPSDKFRTISSNMIQKTENWT